MRLLIVSGKRGGMEAMLPMLRIMEEDPDITPHLCLVDQHLKVKFGLTASKVPFPVFAHIQTPRDGDSAWERNHNMGHITRMIGLELSEADPKYDAIVLYGDRGEVAAAALSAVTNGTPIVHLQAGDETGQADNTYRRMISTAASILFVSNEHGLYNLLNQGIEGGRKNIHVVGDQHIDCLMQSPDPAEIIDISEHDTQYSCVLIYHPETNDAKAEEDKADMLVKSTSQVAQIIAVYPCSDPGHNGVIRSLEKYRGLDKYRLYGNIQSDTFHHLLKRVDFIIGNSSSGIIEAAYHHTPSVDVGYRQEKRVRPPSVFNAVWEPTDIGAQIVAALEYGKNKRRKWSKLYGDGNASEKIVDILKWRFCNE